MLQHSRTTSNEKEPTDINKLADEYFRLAYHGLRAKDKSFNAILQTDYDESIGKINIIAGDVGRVLLNLFNNAFYAVNEKTSAFAKAAADKSAQAPEDKSAQVPEDKSAQTPEDKSAQTPEDKSAQTPEDKSAQGSTTAGNSAQASKMEKYQPTVSLTTKKMGDKIEIRIRDNGNGIPKRLLDKIYQPFFTTKPAGQGTGLGLSLSYNIIKAHNGEIKVETREGEYTNFTIVLPA